MYLRRPCKSDVPERVLVAEVVCTDQGRINVVIVSFEHQGDVNRCRSEQVAGREGIQQADQRRTWEAGCGL